MDDQPRSPRPRPGRRRWAGLAGLAILIGLAAGCSTGPGAGGTIDGTSWILRSYVSSGAQVDVADGVFADATFDRDQLSGFSGCNDFTTSFEVDGSKLAIGELASTMMACEGAPADVEAGYRSALGITAAYTATSTELTLLDVNGTILALFDAAPANPLAGVAWRITDYAVDESAMAVPVEGSEPTVSFIEGGQVSGDTGCNTFSGSYRISGSIVIIGRVASTRMACEEALMAQETAILAALTGATTFSVRGDTATLRDRDGRLVLGLARGGEAAASASPGTSPSPSPAASPSPAPSPSPAASPSPAPSPSSPPPSPSPLPSTAPVLPSPTAIATTSCEIPDEGVTVVYPADWRTLTEPAAFACRLFDPAPVEAPPSATTLPTDPATLPAAGAVVVPTELVSYELAVALALDPARWDVASREGALVDGLPAERIEATSTVEDGLHPAGTTRYTYIVDRETSVVFIETRGSGDGLATNKVVVDLIAASSSLAGG
jgi:heat shock protein HslJ